MFIHIVSIPQAARFASINADLALRLSLASYTENNRKGAKRTKFFASLLCVLRAFAVDFISCGALTGMSSFGEDASPDLWYAP